MAESNLRRKKHEKKEGSYIVNVKDFDIEVPPGDMLKTIFDHQRQLMIKYHPIETANVGHWIPSAEHSPYDLQDRACQLQIKSFAWRITEELTEATLALDEEDRTHYLEELIDALHFSVELCIMSGLGISEFGPGEGVDTLEYIFYRAPAENPQDIVGHTYRVIETLGSAMNRTKLKPWKTTAMLTDERAYRKDILSFFLCLIDLLKISGFTSRSATAMYLNKNAVNQFRIITNY